MRSFILEVGHDYYLCNLPASSAFTYLSVPINSIEYMLATIGIFDVKHMLPADYWFKFHTNIFRFSNQIHRSLHLFSLGGTLCKM